jgi:uncharacterized protein Usg
MSHTVSDEFRKQLSGYGLTTAQIIYRMPDYKRILQVYIWQEYDIFPNFPELKRFLDFWKKKLDGPLHKVIVAHSKLIRPADFKAIDGEFKIN